MALGPGPEKSTYDPRPDREIVHEEAQQHLAMIRGQAKSYLEARYGVNVWYRAPETFSPFEQWIWAVAGGRDEFAEETMTTITEHFRKERES